MSLFSHPTHGPHRKNSHQDLPTRISCRNDGLVILSREGYHPRLHIPSLKAQREKALLDLCVPLEKTSDFHSRFVTSLATDDFPSRSFHSFTLSFCFLYHYYPPTTKASQWKIYHDSSEATRGTNNRIQAYISRVHDIETYVARST